jgi:poly(beta-D-mannuronate) lyase
MALTLVKFRSCFLPIALCLLLLCGALPAAAGPPLQSPWDLHSVALTNRPYTCPAPSHLSPDLTSHGYYKDKQRSVVDKGEEEETKEVMEPYRETVTNITHAADAYQTTGSRAAAECAASLIDAAAKDRFLAGAMNGNQSYHEQKWLVGAIAIAYLKTRPSNVVSPAQSAEILSWLKNVAATSRDYYEPSGAGHTPHQDLNNHRYWAGLEVAAVGIAAGDQGLFNWGLESADVGLRQIDKDGTLPLEMDRGARALGYHLFSAAPLVMLAEFAAVNGKDLYAAHDHALQRLVERATSGATDPSFFSERTGAEQRTPPWSSAVSYAWLRPYVRRFPNPAMSAILAKLDSLDALFLGGLPPD